MRILLNCLPVIKQCCPWNLLAGVDDPALLARNLAVAASRAGAVTYNWSPMAHATVVPSGDTMTGQSIRAYNNKLIIKACPFIAK